MWGSPGRLALTLAAAFGCAALLPIVAASRPAEGDPAPREIRLVAREMAFFVDGESAPNPTLRVSAGERVRLVLRNEDAGMTHDFAIGAWKVGTKTLTARGQEVAVEFRAPDTRGTASYECTPHAQMMRGTVVVE